MEFVITLDCTGKCIHCSQGEHSGGGVHIDDDIAIEVLKNLKEKFNLTSVMTFGGEPLLYAETVCKIHSLAEKLAIPKRQLITNGYFTEEIKEIRETAQKIGRTGVNDVLISADAFHQQTIPVNAVKIFALELQKTGVPTRLNPAWLVSEDDDNVYNFATREIVEEFKSIGISCGEGNVVFPEGNALKYLGKYFDKDKEYVNPYADNPEDVRCVSIMPDGEVFGRNVYKESILEILKKYKP